MVCFVNDSSLNILRFLGYVNMIGMAYEAPSLATGFGAHIALVISSVGP